MLQELDGVDTEAWMALLQRRAAARWMRAAGARPKRVELLALVSGSVLAEGACEEWWAQAAGQVTAAGFQAALEALHDELAEDAYRF